MSGKPRDDDGEELNTPVLFDVGDPLLSLANQPTSSTLPEDAFFVDPYAASSDYVTSTYSRSQRGDFKKSQGVNIFNPEVPQATVPVVGAEEVTSTQVPITRNNMGSEFFAPDPTADLAALDPDAGQKLADQQRDAEMGWGAGGSVLVRAAEELAAKDAQAAAAQRAADQQRDAEMGWGAGGSVLVRAAEELAAKDAQAAAAQRAADLQRDAEMGWGAGGSVLVDAAAKMDEKDAARRQLDEALKVGGDVLIAAAHEFQQRDTAQTASTPSDSKFSERLSGGVQIDSRPKAPESPATATQSIAQRLAGVLSPQESHAASVTSPTKPQHEGRSR